MAHSFESSTIASVIGESLTAWRQLFVYFGYRVWTFQSQTDMSDRVFAQNLYIGKPCRVEHSGRVNRGMGRTIGVIALTGEMVITLDYDSWLS